MQTAQVMDRHGEQRLPFGAWLLAQRDRGDWIDGIASVARMDPLFPKNGDVDAVRARLEAKGADGDAFAALEHAELDWLAY